MEPLRSVVSSVGLAALVCSIVFASAHGGIAPSVDKWLEGAAPGDQVAVWVFFTDKGPASAAEVEAALGRLAAGYAPGAVERRLLARPGRPFDAADLPLFKPYVDALAAAGVEFRTFSRWLNAASVVATAGELEAIGALPFGRSVRRVSGRAGGPEPVAWEESGKEAGALYQYGQAFRQLTQIQVPSLHDEGYTGAGVTIAIFDTGFWLDHEVFANLNLIAEHDFINNDNVTANEPGDPAGQHDHGTMCLSLMAADRPGTMMGAAFDADYILAKTENVADEQPVEEDYWIAAAEWADSLGAQVISSSLCYSDWYTYEDMDGQTAPITNAADQAALNGIVVVNAAGNSGALPWRYIAAPADGDSVVTVGSVDSLGTRSSFSSQGPTYDGRTKPTIMAMGQADYVASTSGTTSYRRGSGTSFATPLTAGAIALVLQKNPGWLPGNVIEAVTATGTRASYPDTLYGWGILQAYTASEFAPSGVGRGGTPQAALGVYPNPCRTSFYVTCPGGGLEAARTTVRVFDVAGRLVAQSGLSGLGPTRFNLDGADGVAPGVVFVEVPGRGRVKLLILK